jgi:DNA-directed RNA polymerase
MSQETNAWARNLAKEIDSKTRAIDKREREVSKAKEKGRESVVEPYRGLVNRLVDSVRRRLASDLQAGLRVGRSHQGYLRLRDCGIDPDKATYIAVRTTIDKIGHGNKIQPLVMAIGKRIEDEVRLDAFKKAEPKLWAWRRDEMNSRGTTDYEHMRKVYLASMRRLEIEWEEWSLKDRVKVGEFLLNYIYEEGALEKVHVIEPFGKKKKSSVSLVLTEEAQAALKDREGGIRESLKPWMEPMLDVPRDWTTVDDGGYEIHRMPLVKTHNREQLERAAGSEMPLVYAAINSLQQTGWCVNTDVLVTAQELWAKEEGRAGLPPQFGTPEPVRPLDLPDHRDKALLSDEQKALLASYKSEKRGWHETTKRNKSKVVAVCRTLESAERLGDQRFYFPIQLDYRGRFYYVPLFLNPQGDDLARGLLRFAEGKPLGVSGGYWLAVHLANSFGHDKVSLNERAEWTDEHSDQIREVADDPLTNTWWHEADAPFQFLAACLEWDAYQESGEDPEFVSHLPVGLDGTCSGLQHWSAIGRDEFGAAATNLAPSKAPQDIYQLVAQRTIEKLEAKAEQHSIARQWIAYGVDRKLVKRSVMCKPYGVTRYTVLGDLFQQLQERSKEEGDLPFEHLYDAVAYIVPFMMDATNEVIVSAQESMRFVQAVAKQAAKEELPLAWSAPSGFPIYQQIMDERSIRITTNLLGGCNLRFKDGKGYQVDKRRQRTSIAPNLIHSLDASHLTFTIVRASEATEGPLSWSVVHDQVGTHAGDLDEVSRHLNKSFFDLYEDHCPLQAFRTMVADGLGSDADLPPVPERGNFDLNEVLKAEYLFS